jgi:chemotaxis regulatin CheY-phosphate phosphatase CheZ
MSTSDNLQMRIQKEIGELTESIAGMVTNFKKLQRPLVESREKVPQATNQLDKISQQTEAATAQMLDMIEQITQREDEVIKGINLICSKALAGDTSEIEQLSQELVGKATDNLNNAFQIMESLQFQDITAQQMDHAASLLEDIEGKLQHILKTMGASEEMAASLMPAVRKTRAYDPHADFVDRRTDQKDIDSLFEKEKS